MEDSETNSKKNILNIKYYFIISKDIKSIKTIIKKIILINLYSGLLKSIFFCFKFFIK